MKKHLLLLPLTGLILSGCQFTIFGKTFTFFEKDNESDGLDLPDNFKKEYEGYKLATSIKDGGEYILGVYRINEDVMRFASGEYHSDSNGKYSFYLGTTTETKQAATIKVKSLGNDEYSLQMKAEGKVWNNKYIGIYPAESNAGNFVMSIAPLDSLDQTTFIATNGKKTDEVEAQTQTHFKYIETYDELPAYTVAAYYKHEEKLDPEPVPKFLGTGHNPRDGQDDYISMDCKSYEEALSLDSYDLAHLYEKK